jgi:hypothetical protein
MIKVHKIEGRSHSATGVSNENMTKLTHFLEKIQSEGATVTKVKFENFVMNKHITKAKTKTGETSESKKSSEVTSILEIIYVIYDDNKCSYCK